jgi:hypothetical protein
MNQDPQNICERAANFLLDAGFLPSNEVCPDCLAMHRDGVCASVAIRYEPSTTTMRLTVLFAQDKPKRGIFRNGRGDLRIFIEPPELLGLLCWLSSSHDELLPHEADTWLAQIVALCPQTYAVLTTKNGLETLALVASNEPLAPAH